MELTQGERTAALTLLGQLRFRDAHFPRGYAAIVRRLSAQVAEAEGN